MNTILKVNIAGVITQVTKQELKNYLEKFPEYKENYFIIS